MESIGRGWMFYYWLPITNLIISRPLYISKRIIYRSKDLVKCKLRNLSHSLHGHLLNNSFKNIAYINEIAVKETSRRLGIGKQLLEHCIMLVRKEKMAKLNLNVDPKNIAAIRLYEALGFKKIAEDKSTNYYIYSQYCAK